MEYNQTIIMTKFNGVESRWTINGCDSLQEAQEKCLEWAKKGGWTPPKWWQWWRWNDINPKFNKLEPH